MGRRKKDMKETDDERTYKMLKKQVDLSCPFCQPHRGENDRCRSKHGAKKSRKKNRRRKRGKST
jgi:hypothetical protein